jgi:hypothetical protein
MQLSNEPTYYQKDCLTKEFMIKHNFIRLHTPLSDTGDVAAHEKHMLSGASIFWGISKIKRQYGYGGPVAYAKDEIGWYILYQKPEDELNELPSRR